MSQNLSSAAVVMGSLRVDHCSDNLSMVCACSRPYWESLHDFRSSGEFFFKDFQKIVLGILSARMSSQDQA